MSQNSATTAIAANVAAFKSFQTLVSVGFELAGPTVKSKIALSQVDLLTKEYEDIAAYIETIELPEPTEGAYPVDALEAAMGEVLTTRLEQFGALSKDAMERIAGATDDIGGSIDRPENETVLTAEMLTQASRFTYLQGVAEHATVFGPLVEGAPGAIAARLIERLKDKLPTTLEPTTPEPTPPGPHDIHLIEPVS